MIAGFEKDNSRLLIVSDLLAFGAAWSIGSWSGFLTPVSDVSGSALVLGLGLLWGMVLAVNGAYRFSGGGRQIFSILRGSAVFALLTIVLAPFGGAAIPGNKFLALALVAGSMTFVFRKTVAPVLRFLAGNRGPRRILVAGEGATADHIETKFRSDVYQVKRWKAALVNGQYPSNGAGADAFKTALREFNPHEVIIVVGKIPQKSIDSLTQACRDLGITWQFAPDLAELGFPNLQIALVDGVPLLATKGSAFEGLNLRIKQLMDLALGLILLMVAAPIMILCWIFIRLDSPGPAIIRQPRLGYKGRIFNIYKFRSMHQNVTDAAHRAYIQQCIQDQAYTNGEAVKKVFKITNDKRVTRVGRVLRRYSLDELPQIFNILKLEMSLVGPRPSLAYELESYEDWHKERLDAVPGLTGLWQVSGRSLLSFNDMVRLDVEYLQNWTPAEDVRLIVRTIPAIFRGTGL